ncbi:MAG: radical SAM protein [Euryarchaeota archaeon]|nr:radical SAM protein [Euryarchaeota archaeon]
MEVIDENGREDIAKVYIARNREDDRCLIEFTEALQRPLPIQKKFMIIVSTLYGCPVNCQICDVGPYHGKLTKKEILEQIDYIIERRFSDDVIRCEKLKIQFARVGEPAFNPAVLDVLRELPERYEAEGLMPCISTIAPINSRGFFEELIEIKNEYYTGGKFQLQFSIHTTDQKIREKIIPAKKWNFKRISEYGERFFEDGDRKITLNFATIKGNPIEPHVLRDNFNPEKFILKFTPVNPTETVKRHKLESFIDPEHPDGDELFEKLGSYGFETILSIGDVEENEIGSNCGQLLNAVREGTNDRN